MIEEIKNFIKEAGRLALEKSGRQDHRLNFKWGDEAVSSMVTEVDTEISRRFKDFAAQKLSAYDYLIIDEESVASLQGRVFEEAAKHEYLLVIDPIDGTINYAADLPLYGISIGVMKNGRPLYGFLYAPALDELVYTDGCRVWFEHDGRQEELEPNRPSLSRVVMGHAWRIKLKPHHFDGHYVMQDYFSAVIYFVFLALGQVKAAFVRANLWDIAAGMAICNVLGMGFYDYDNGEELVCFDEAHFERNCRVKKMYVCGFKSDFEMIKNLTCGLVLD